MSEDETIESVQRMGRDFRVAAKTLGDAEARFLVDAYYTFQEVRKALNNQQKQLEKEEPGKKSEPSEVIKYVGGNAKTLESQMKAALDYYSATHPMGSWMRAHVGLGPVISAGLLAHIDIKKAPTVGHIWRFAGLDPSLAWVGRKRAEKAVAEARGGPPPQHIGPVPLKFPTKPAVLAALGLEESNLPRWIWDTKTSKDLISALSKRPWNASLKLLCWKLGESFTKHQNRPGCYYGQIYAKRKVQEIFKNEAGDFSDQAVATLIKVKIGKSTDAYRWYSGQLTAEDSQTFWTSPIGERLNLASKLANKPGSGVQMLPPQRILLRSQRYAVKLFLSHLHHAWYELEYGKPPPLPYPIAHLGHVHFITPDKAAAKRA